MNHYTIISLSPRPLLGDAIAVGVVLFADKIIFKTYPAIVTKAAKLMDLDSATIKRDLKSSLKSIQSLYLVRDAGFFDGDTSSANLISYLHQYAQGVINFSEPKPVQADISIDQLAQSLFQLPLAAKSNTKKESRPQLLMDKLTTISDRVHVDVSVSPARMPAFIYSMQFEMLGANGELTSAKYINFDSKIDSVRNNVSNYDSSLRLLSRLTNKPLGKHFIVATPPQSDQTDRHYIWDFCNQDFEGVEVIHPEQASVIVDHVTTTGAHHLDELRG